MKWFLSFLLVLQLFGCHDKVEQKKFRVGFSQPIIADDWRLNMYNEMLRQLIFEDEIELILKDANAQTDVQISQIIELIDEGIDLLIVSPNETEPLRPIIESIYQNGIPVIILDRRINSDKYTAYVGSDNRLIGEAGAQYVANLLNGKGKVLEVYEALSITPFHDRHVGFRQIMNAYESIIIDSVKAISKGESEYRALLLSNHYDVVFAATDIAALFAYDVAHEMNKSEGMQFIGVDGLSSKGGGMDLIEQGKLTASLLYPSGGDIAIDVASKILKGEPFEKENILQTMIIDGSNVKTMRMQALKLQTQHDDILALASKLNVFNDVFKTQKTLTYLFAFAMILSIAMAAFVLTSLIEKRRINQELIAKNDQIIDFSKKAEEATQAKFRFFTNISHEFRTPLTLILSPIDDMLLNDKAATFKSDLTLIKKNAVRLYRLINQIMDFRKIDNSMMSLRISRLNFIDFLKEIIQSFDRLATTKNIELRLIQDEHQVDLWIDKNMMDKVFFNLISNAFKFTPVGGFIKIVVKSTENSRSVNISVIDSGIGLTNEQVKNVFDRFYQGEQYRSLGSGIGLSLTKEIVELHKGTISVNSVLGSGTYFDINLLKGKDHFGEDTIIETDHVPTPSDESLFLLESELNSTEHSEASMQYHESTILLIEDNIDIRAFLRSKLEPHHNVIEAKDVPEGINLAFNEVPDLVICDLMLKKESGYDVIRNLKGDIRSSHIPIIVLTAKSSFDDKIESLRLGVDDFITKPFDFFMLLEQIHMLLINRQKLRDHYMNELPTDQKNGSGSKLDKKFINQFKALVEENIANSNLSVAEIGHELGLSRVQLYRKVKAIIGCSVNEYINNVRLNKAKILVNEGNMNISEIGNAVGFSSPSYFSTAFKNHFGISPSEFKSN